MRDFLTSDDYANYLVDYLEDKYFLLPQCKSRFRNINRFHISISIMIKIYSNYETQQN